MGKKNLSVQIQIHGAKPLSQEAEAVFTVKLSVHRLFQKFLISHILTKKPHLQWPNDDSQMSSGKKYFIEEET